MILYSPNGGIKIDCHPTKVDEMLAKGWKKTDPKKKSVASKSVTTTSTKEK